MTMLNRMRQHKSWLKWSLGIVVLTFILLYVPSFLKDPGTAGAGSTDVLATVNGREITGAEYQIAYQMQVQAFRAAYGGNITDDMLKQLGIKQRVMQQLVDEQAMLIEATRLGLTITDGELRERIMHMTEFQENGRFIGGERFAQLLSYQRPPLTPADFDDRLRRRLLSEKLQAAVTGWVRVSDADVERDYREKNEKAKIELAIFKADQFKTAVQPTDAEIAAQFNAHQESYRVPEKRRVRLMAVDAQALRAKMTATDQEIATRYTQSAATFSAPEMVRASHILIKSDGKDPKKDEAAKKLAESILVKAKAPGADFAALAKQYSEDGSKDKGGDVDFFPHEKMVKEFSDAAFKLKVGELDQEVVKSQFGYHIIKLTDRKAATTKSLAEVRPQIDNQIRWEKAQAEAEKLAGQLATQIKKPEDLDTVAKANGLKVADSGLFARDEPIAGIGFVPAVAAEAFKVNLGKVSGAIQTEQGTTFLAVVEVKQPYLPALDEAKAKVKDDVARTKALDVAKSRAAALAASGGKGNFAAAAKAAGVEVKSTDMSPRGSAYAEVGVSSAIDDAAFALGKGGVTQPITTDAAIIVAHVVDKADITADAFNAEKTGAHEQLLLQRRQEFFSAYMSKAKAKMKTDLTNAGRILIAS